MNRTHVRAAALALIACTPAIANAQAAPQHDIVHLGELNGVRPPDAFFEFIAENPDAFTFEGSGFVTRPGGDGPSDPGIAQIFGQYDGNVEGTFRFPLVMGWYAGENEPTGETREAIQAQFFDGPNPTGTVEDYFLAASNGRVTLLGEAQGWAQSTLTRAQVTGGVSALGGASRIGEFVTQLAAARDDGTLDWARYDNDGPDGIPNSGDDDGFVDVLGVLHPTHGAECGGTDRESRIWSHRWSLRSATGQPYTTSSPSANGGLIRINDYTIQPARNCSDTDINDIGVFAHELGHGFGLPDLYAVSADHSGIGRWGLMGSGSYGCAGGESERPCFPGAWTREQLGWGSFVDLAPGIDHGELTLRSPADGGDIYRYRVPGTDTYYLLEYRGRNGFDGSIPAEGLLVWQIDEGVIAANRRRNRINSASSSMGVWVRQADGESDLTRSSGGNRGDAGDPFPGSAGRTEFHAGTLPAARILGGDAAMLTLRDIALVPQGVRARVNTAPVRLTLSAQGASGGELFEIGGTTVGDGHVATLAPFESVSVTAKGGEVVGEGIRTGFDRWSDGSTERTRDYLMTDADATLVANYGALEYRVNASVTSPFENVLPGVVSSNPASPDSWYPAGTEVFFGAAGYPGFAFERWTGALEGQPNPTPVRVDEPLEFGAVFASEFAVEGPPVTDLVAGQETVLELGVFGAVGGRTWSIVSGAPPQGLQLESDGRLVGTVLEAGTFELRVRVRDGRGLEAEGDIRLDVAAPTLSADQLAGPIIGLSERPSAGELLWLDYEGNRNGAYDLGDAVLYRSRPASAPKAAPGSPLRVVTRIHTLVLPPVSQEEGR